MTTIKTLISAVALSAASTVFAECPLFPKGEESGPGVIGKRYAEASLVLIDAKATTRNTYGTNLGGNLPVCNGLDLNGGYSYSALNHSDPDIGALRKHNIGGSAVIYNTIEEGIKPFVSFGLGGAFSDRNFDVGISKKNNRRNHISSNYGTWNVGIGAEIPYKWVSVIPSITYNDDFRTNSKSEQYFVYGAEVYSWITPKVAIYVSASWYDQQHVADRNFGVGVGARLRF